MPMLVLMEEAYPWVAVFSPYGSVHGGIVPAAGEIDPDPAKSDAAPDDGMLDALPASCLQPSSSYAGPH
jgi:hypothetical protein